MQSLSAECSYNLIFDGGKLMMIASIVSIHVITENDGEAGGGGGLKVEVKTVS